MISIGRLGARDRSAWEELFAGYHAFYGRPNWPRENYDKAWRRLAQDEQLRAAPDGYRRFPGAVIPGAGGSSTGTPPAVASCSA